jgi:protease-4
LGIDLLMFEYIAELPIHGTLTRTASFLERSAPVELLLNILTKIKDKRSIKAFIFDIDSPGGEAYPSKELAMAIRKIKKPTIANVKSAAASGAYWIASSCDKIVADEISAVGSIGVMSLRPDVSDFLQRFGIKIDTASSGKFKEYGLPFQEQTKEEETMINEHVQLIYQSFYKSVEEKRKFNKDMLTAIREGKVFFGKEALEAGLIDKLGDRETCIELAKELGRLRNPKIIDYSYKLKPGLLKLLFR